MVWLVGLARVALVLIPLLVILPGCLSAAPQACQGEACDAPPTTPRFITRSPGVDFPPLPEDPALRAFRLEECTGLSAAMDLPYQSVAAVVPPAFEPWERVPGTAAVVLLPLACRRAVFADHVLENYREVAILAGVFPKNRSWEAGGVSFYVLDQLVSHAAAAQALASWGLPGTEATFAVGDHLVPVLPGTSWRVRSPSLIFELEYGHHEPSQNVRTATNYYWTGSGPFLRSTHHKAYTFDTLYQPGLLRASGSATTAQLMPAGAWSWLGSPMRTFSSAGVVDLELFGP
jgi:hypothetical protein